MSALAASWPAPQGPSLLQCEVWYRERRSHPEDHFDGFVLRYFGYRDEGSDEVHAYESAIGTPAGLIDPNTIPRAHKPPSRQGAHKPPSRR